ncbi:MAG: SDR family NAD(P)-dependent oxidoreductase [Betaproteobacteria bacterium]|nr:SDR family NAD(P)-dependent oxidoreductase [Betaproteobacteria bacterium]
MALNPVMRDWPGKRVWLVGASSGIGRATASALHARGAVVIVSARQGAILQQFVAQHPGAMALPLDVTDAAALRSAAHTLAEAGGLACVVYCAGHYRAHRATAFDLPDMLRHNAVNYVGALNLLDAVLPVLLAQGRGHISLVGSVAGYRGLPQSLAYGPTKAALIHLAESLYTDLRPRDIGVSLINPGFVATPLTAQNTFPMPALVTPELAARRILQGWARGAFEIHFPRRFTVWMKLLQWLPYRAFFALTRRMAGA